MNIYSWFLLISSAFLYVLPFWFPDYLWWIVILFPIPIFYVAINNNLSFKDGFVWGTFVFSLHLSGVIWGITRLAVGPLYLAIIPAFLLVLYASGITGLLFWSSGLIQKKSGEFLTHIQKALLWVGVLWVFSFWLDRCCLLPLDRCEGYLLMHPLLPLVTHPSLLTLLPYLGKPLLTFFFYALSASILLFLLHPSLRFFLLYCTTLIPWALSIALSLNKRIDEAPSWLSRIVHIPKKFSRMENVSLLARILRAEIKQVLDEYPQTEVVIIPESSVYSPYLFCTPAIATYFSPDYLERPLHIIAGSFYEDNGLLRNSCYWIKNGSLQHRFDKRHSMALIERVPSLWGNNSFLHKMYFCKMSEIAKAQNPRPRFLLFDDVAVVPYICSELFFHEHPDDAYVELPILLIANDTWCPAQYLRYLMSLGAKFKAIHWERDIIYISYHHALFFNKFGSAHHLQSSP